jgi:NAD(P)-dependent dehydrogenase (short-subunit alcohol dehydrogenase family)
MIATLDAGAEVRAFASRSDAPEIATRGPVTPDHVIRTKRVPLVITEDIDRCVGSYGDDYGEYFSRHDDGSFTPLDPAPCWALWPDRGLVAFGSTPARARQVGDIARHTVRCIHWGESLGGWRPLGEEDLFPVEYWELEQAKLAKGASGRPLDGRVALVTGAAGGIGAATATCLRASGCAVVGLDLDPGVVTDLTASDALGVQCDVRDASALDRAITQGVHRFGGIDILISNAGRFPMSALIEEMTDDGWAESLELNVTSHMKVLRACAPYLRLGDASAVVVVASRNVPAPGPGVGAYSAAKAALTQLARVAALELAPDGVRVNVLHPDKVFDTGLWDPDKLQARADHYGITVEEYRRRNLLGTEVRAADVGALATAMAGPLFGRTTGAQVPVDGGDPRVI